MSHDKLMSWSKDGSPARIVVPVESYRAGMEFPLRSRDAARVVRLIAVVSLLLACGTCFASSSPMHVLDKQQFVAWDAQARADLEKPASDNPLTPADADMVKATLTKMEETWQRAGSKNPTDDELIELANDQEIASTILDRAPPDSRLVCERLVVTGTRVAMTYCRSIAKIKQEEVSSRTYMHDSNQHGGI